MLTFKLCACIFIHCDSYWYNICTLFSKFHTHTPLESTGTWCIWTETSKRLKVTWKIVSCLDSLLQFNSFSLLKSVQKWVRDRDQWIWCCTTHTRIPGYDDKQSVLACIDSSKLTNVIFHSNQKCHARLELFTPISARVASQHTAVFQFYSTAMDLVKVNF